jgi:uncharacterized protein YbaR (Trm112 family)
MMISKELLEILACPKCKGPVELTVNEDGLLCKSCRLLYEIREGIPVMLVDEARKLEDEPEDQETNWS